MTQENHTPSDAAVSDINDESIPTLSLTLGQKLKAAREEKGLSIGDVSGHLKLSVKQVEALENNAFERLPNAVFIRGFLRSYAKFLKMDEQSIIQELDKILPLSQASSATSQTEPNDTSLPHETQSSNNHNTPSPSGNHKSIMMLALIGTFAIVLGLGGYYLLSSKNIDDTNKNNLPAHDPGVISEINANAQVTPPPPVSEENIASSDTISNDKLIINNRHKTYMSITNGKGETLFDGKLIPAKTVQEFPAGDAPYKVRIGYAIDTSITFKGQPIDLAGKVKRKTLEITIPEEIHSDSSSDTITP